MEIIMSTEDKISQNSEVLNTEKVNFFEIVLHNDQTFSEKDISTSHNFPKVDRKKL